MDNKIPTDEELGLPLEDVRDRLILALIAAGYDISGTDHDEANYIEVGGTDYEFRLRIEAL